MKKMINQLSVFLLFFAVGSMIVMSCKKEEEIVPPIVPPGINLSSGAYLVDGNNQTLYIFTRDVDGSNNCSGGCEDKWQKD